MSGRKNICNTQTHRDSFAYLSYEQEEMKGVALHATLEADFQSFIIAFTLLDEKMEGLLNTGEFCCPICLDLLKDPVAIPCGHSYCMDCINDYWHKDEELKIFDCPQCRQTYSPRPVLNRNCTLAEMMEKLKNLEVPDGSHIYSNGVPGDVACDFCIRSEQKAAKSCLVCLASYCQNHLQSHYSSPVLKKHKLIDACVNLQEKICPRHDKCLEIYCRSDQQCICLLCVMDEHKGHDTVSAAAESAKKQNELETTRQNYMLKIHSKEKELLELQQAVDSLKSSARSAVENGEQIFREVMQSIERRWCKFRDLIRDQERAAESMLQTLEQEITELKQKRHELEMLLESEDQIHVLQNCYSFSSSGPPDQPFTIATLSDFGKVNDAISALRMKLEDVFKGQWLRIYQAARSMKILHCTVPRIRSEFLYHSCPLQLNPLTSHKDLSLSKEHREVTVRSRVQSCPDHPERFDYWCQVLGTEGLTGCSYWEVEWRGMGVNIAVAYKNIARKGDSSEAHFGYNDKSWSLFCYRKGYVFWHNGIVHKICQPGSSTIGVYLDHRAGTLAFYSVGDSMSLLHRVQTSFTQPLYPGFAFSCYGASVKFRQLE
ncbi:putative tripartite motif-containing protein 16-like [Triplophysa rosa]|uniref:Tripartite motif-containing protein 16-like n=2 Tax=Triplophysa rosa TaxID=992332 RepID=A0A9W7WX40_TRIRA|nr:putative tripartite motif-containing protein 16-like [Triplophysa rosa]